jgi:hypothetical protein
MFVVLAALAAAPVWAQAYRCGAHTYSQVPCSGGRAIGAAPHHATDKSRPPPQDRAVAAKRAVLTPEERRECRALDVRKREEEGALRARGEGATLQDEMPLVNAQRRFRELGC